MELVRFKQFAADRGIPEPTLRHWARTGLLNQKTGLHSLGSLLFINPKEFDAFFLDNDKLTGKRGRKKRAKPAAADIFDFTESPADSHPPDPIGLKH
jgi:hypothetical protein